LSASFRTSPADSESVEPFVFGKNLVDYCDNPHYRIRFVILIWSQIVLEEVHIGYSKAGGHGGGMGDMY